MEKRFEELDANEYLKFYQSLHDARLCNKHGCFVTLGSPENYVHRKNFFVR